MSKEQDIVEGNFKISVFNGWTYKNVNEFIKDKTSTELHNYHEDWNKLMPVVEKIEDLRYCTEVSLFSCFIMAGDLLDSEMVIESHSNSKIEAAWQAVIQFIQWYQQNQKPQ